jgi:hypothetical protein
MTDLLIFCLCVSLACTLIHIAFTWPDMILYDFEKTVLHHHLPEWFRKPLYECMICMCSLWTIFFWTLYLKPITVELLFAMMITGGINAVICIGLNQTDYGC